MSEVLDQSEIDALLSSVAGGSGGAGAQPMAPNEAPLFSMVEADTYDFKRPERVSKDQIRAISSIHEVFARNFGATLSGLLRTIIDVRVVGVEQLTYNEFIHCLPNPTCFMILRAPPLEGQMCLELSPLIVYPFVDRLLGGDNSNLYVPQRPLTSIEWRLIGRIVDRALEHLSEVWRNLVDARFETVEMESNPQLVHIVAPTEVVVFVTFEIKLGQTAGTMSLCIPFNTIELVLSHLTGQSWFYKPKPATELQRKRLLRNLAKSPISLTAYLGQTTIRLSELRDLRPGDLVPLEKRVGQDLILKIAGRNKFAGLPGQFRGQRALRLTRRADIDEML
ncbi:MAG: flagellar motor switch protein FliM [Phycisphaerae bacterium]